MSKDIEEARAERQLNKNEAFNEIAWKVANVKFVHHLSSTDIMEILDNLRNRYATGKEYDNTS